MHGQKKRLRIAAVVSQGSGFGQTLLTGCARWLSENPRLGVWVTKEEVADPRLDLSPYDGVLYASEQGRVARALRRFKKPAINLGGASAVIPPNSVLSDDNAAARLAIEHFRERGRRNIAVITIGKVVHYDRRTAAFLKTAAAMHLSPLTVGLAPLPTARDWAAVVEEIRGRAGSLGVFAVDNQVGSRLCLELTQAGVMVPEEVAVVGVGNETNLCEFALPPLSSVDIAIDLRSYQALSLLVEQIRGQPPLTQPLLIQPRGVIVRHSSDLYSVGDPDVRLALRYIHDHADEAIRIEEVVEAVNVSRRRLEQRFARHLRRTMHEEIWRAHLQLAKQFLIQSDLTVSEVAVRSGFGTLSNFCTLFRRAEGIAPGRFRQRQRGYRGEEG